MVLKNGFKILSFAAISLMSAPCFADVPKSIVCGDALKINLDFEGDAHGAPLDSGFFRPWLVLENHEQEPGFDAYPILKRRRHEVLSGEQDGYKLSWLIHRSYDTSGRISPHDNSSDTYAVVARFSADDQLIEASLSYKNGYNGESSKAELQCNASTRWSF